MGDQGSCCDATQLTHDACWLSLLFDPETRLEASQEIVRTSFRASTREAQIGALLVGGLYLK